MTFRPAFDFGKRGDVGEQNDGENRRKGNVHIFYQENCKVGFWTGSTGFSGLKIEVFPVFCNPSNLANLVKKIKKASYFETCSSPFSCILDEIH